MEYNSDYNFNKNTNNIKQYIYKGKIILFLRKEKYIACWLMGEFILMKNNDFQVKYLLHFMMH